MKDHTPPRDAPASDDQSDLPETSQIMPLHDLGMRPVAQPNAYEEAVGAVLTTSEIAKLRTLYARARRAQRELEDFWIEHMPGELPGPKAASA